MDTTQENVYATTQSATPVTPATPATPATRSIIKCSPQRTIPEIVIILENFLSPEELKRLE